MCDSSESMKSIGKALLQVQAAMTAARKDSRNPHFNSSYASLDAVLEAVRQPLSEAGLVVIQTPAEAGQGLVALETKLLHVESGEWLSCKLSVPLQNVTPQGVGSCLTYLRRYSLTTLLGIPQEDDDGNAACSRRPASSQPQRPAPVRQGEAPRLNEAELEGVVFRKVEEGGGTFLVAEGRTREAAEALKRQGFRWNGKAWWKVA